MNVRLLGVGLVFAASALTFTMPARANDALATRASTVALKMGSYYLGDDTAGQHYGGGSKVSLGLEYRLRHVNVGSRSGMSVYVDYAYGNGPGGTLAMYSAGLARRTTVGRPTRNGGFPYVGVGVGANINIFNQPRQPGITRQAAFAQKLFIGVQRGDGVFYELHFRAAPQNAGIITSGLGFSLGYHL